MISVCKGPLHRPKIKKIVFKLFGNICFQETIRVIKYKRVISNIQNSSFECDYYLHKLSIVIRYHIVGPSRVKKSTHRVQEYSVLLNILILYKASYHN